MVRRIVARLAGRAVRALAPGATPRFRRWRQAGAWPRVLAQVQNATGLPRLMVDSTTVRAHQVAAGAKKDSPVG